MRDQNDIGLPFMKMHGLGNDFVVLDARVHDIDMSAALARALADRHRGVGFDQLAIITPGATDAHLTFYNADGSMSAACGNATRCIARMLMDEAGQDTLTLSTEFGVLHARDAGQGLTSVNMGHPQVAWDTIPLAEAMDTLVLPIEGGPTATNMGNPHCTFFVDDVSTIALEQFGPTHEIHPLFPQKTNVQIAQVTDTDRIRMRVWERGTGITLASGSSSCATAVAASRRGLTGRAVTIDLDGGSIEVRWTDEGVWMTGPTAHVFSGTLTASFLQTV